nr:MAG TPA: hypothetical protein [Caudoviricetes sp.]
MNVSAVTVEVLRAIQLMGITPYLSAREDR